MKVRSAEELTDLLADDLKARKREIFNMTAAVARARGHERAWLMRAGYTLLYAHLEGFIRTAGTAYLVFVRHQRHKFKELKPNFVAAALKTKIELFAEVKKSSVLTQVVKQLFETADEIAEFEWSGEIDCRSNLSSEVLNEITYLLGIDFAKYETRRQILDNSLLFNRNGIAHGELLQIDEASFAEARTFVVDLLDDFRTDIENAAVTRAFKRLVQG
jgi:hypothetical protein